MSHDAYLSERLPRRHKWYKATVTLYTIGFLLSITVVGIFIGAPLLILAGIFALIQRRYPVTKVTCPFCNRKLKVELDVQKFHCVCHNHLAKVGDEWQYYDSLKERP